MIGTRMRETNKTEKSLMKGYIKGRNRRGTSLRSVRARIMKRMSGSSVIEKSVKEESFRGRNIRGRSFSMICMRRRSMNGRKGREKCE